VNDYIVKRRESHARVIKSIQDFLSRNQRKRTINIGEKVDSVRISSVCISSG